MHHFQDSIKKALIDAFPELQFSFLGKCPPLCFLPEFALDCIWYIR